MIKTETESNIITTVDKTKLAHSAYAACSFSIDCDSDFSGWFFAVGAREWVRRHIVTNY